MSHVLLHSAAIVTYLMSLLCLLVFFILFLIWLRNSSSICMKLVTPFTPAIDAAVKNVEAAITSLNYADSFAERYKAHVRPDWLDEVYNVEAAIKSLNNS